VKILSHQFCKRIEARKGRDGSFTLAGTSTEDFVAYMGRNQTKVEPYRKGSPDIKKQIHDLSGQVKSLLQRHATLDGSARKIPPLL